MNEEDDVFGDEDHFGDVPQAHPRIHNYLNDEQAYRGWLYSTVLYFIWQNDSKPIKMTRVLKDNCRQMFADNTTPEDAAKWLTQAVNHNQTG